MAIIFPVVSENQKDMNSCILLNFLLFHVASKLPEALMKVKEF